MEKNKIGEYIKIKRKAKGLTQQELGNLIYVTDKAISKWERGLGLPDITILDKLAKVLDTTVNNILSGSDEDNDKINITEELDKINKIIADNNHLHKKRIIYLSTLFMIIIGILIINNISFGYTLKKFKFSHFHPEKEITLGIPKTSFMPKYNDKSFSFKNFRNKNILENEVKKYLKTLKYLSCNDTIYYYNDLDNFSITSYSVDNHILYNTISYTIVDDDYCFINKLNEYENKLGGLKKYHGINLTISFYEDWQNKLVFAFRDDIPNNDNGNEFTASIKIEYLTRINDKQAHIKKLEESIGTYEIKDDKLYYYRTNIKEKSSDINIPEVSIFEIDNHNLILNNNYLSKYYSSEIILE